MSGTKRKPKAGEAWEAPPTFGRPDWSEVAVTLRKNPMEWLKVYTDGRATWANAIGRGRVRALRPDLGFELRTADNQRTDPRTCTLYMRFNPDKADALTELFAGKK